MAGLLDNVNQRTQLVGKNRLELLLFHLRSRQKFGINVFKVKEVLLCPPLSSLPESEAVVRGVAHIRGETISIIDLGFAIGLPPMKEENLSSSFVIITEYNRRTQGFLVNSVDRIANLNWEEVAPPPEGAGKDVYLTAVTKIEDQLVEIIDVEKVLADVTPLREDVDESIVAKGSETDRSDSLPILVVDDSMIARRQVERCLNAVGMSVITMNDGRQALDYLNTLTADGSRATDHIAMMISDVEMPEMDGYTLVSRCKESPQLNDLYAMLHTSLSGVFNGNMVKKVGADDFMAKFSPDELAERVMTILDQA